MPTIVAVGARVDGVERFASEFCKRHGAASAKPAVSSCVRAGARGPGLFCTPRRGHETVAPSCRVLLSEGGMTRLETLIELKFLNSSFSSLSS